ncbi:alpha-N-acetylgalactosamine-specific lectin-like [Branchiostoma floridae]|uniref:Alpha-N-acetylgalactosamine-specific lectin-like n=1 Tax=Branchiostoma floridae TaxID=7739 RepID=A0A9J7KZJ8_BRAFL|nr:alpha-N-acetylgalactosamine-specific lectin-like [Branchiostoma floridae]
MKTTFVIGLTLLLVESAFGDETGDFNGYHYRAVTSRLNYDQAQGRCISYGGYLVHIKSSRQQSFLANMASAASGSGYWIGCSDRQTEGDWRWSDGSPLSYTHWYVRQPDDYKGAQDCGILRDDYDFFHWDDAGCTGTYYSLCQIGRISHTPNEIATTEISIAANTGLR